MLNIITKEVPIEEELKEKIEFVCKYNNLKCKIRAYYNKDFTKDDVFDINYIMIDKYYLKDDMEL